jgi:lipoprotein-anchoring transpeptidase ErfK/SrfK
MTRRQLTYFMRPGKNYSRVVRTIKRITILLALLCTLSLPASGESAAAASPDIAAEDSVYLWINKGRNRLYVMLNDVPVYQFRVATGRDGSPTPVGTFRIVTKVVNPYYLPDRIPGGSKDNPLGTRWMGLSIGNGYKYGIHGTSRPYSIGHSVSSGCVRMNNRDIEFLFRHIPLRTTVVITDK